MAKRTYSQEEVDAIFERAIEQESKDSGKLSHEDLVAAAAEVGISSEAIAAAATDLDKGESNAGEAQIVRAWRKHAWRNFARHLVPYVLVNAMLAYINLLTSPGFLWFPIVVLAWGVGVVSQLLAILFTDDEHILERERKKQSKRARRERWRRRGDDFEKAVTEGVRVLLEAANKQHGRVRIEPEGEPLSDDEEGDERRQRS